MTEEQSIDIDETPEDLILFFDTETTDLPNFKARNSDPSQPKVIQLAAVLGTKDRVYAAMNLIIDVGDTKSAPKAFEAHQITTEVSNSIGWQAGYAFNLFHSMCMRADKLIAHNAAFDKRLLAIMSRKLEHESEGQSVEMWEEIKVIPSECTMTNREIIQYVKALYPSGRAGYKWPKLTELHVKLFGDGFEGAHDALVDVNATRECYYELKERGII